MSTDGFSPADFPSLRADAGGERERARVRGYAEGHAEGYRAGRAIADAERAGMLAMNAEREADRRRELDAALSVLSRVSDALVERTTALIGASADRVVDGAIDLAELILHAELSDPDAAAAAALRRAMAAGAEVEARRVRVSEEDLRALERVGSVIDSVTLSADATLAPGDAVVEFDDGCIDARIDAALERARNAARKHVAGDDATAEEATGEDDA